MKPIEIKKGIYWVGAVDPDVRSFHGHTYDTKRGTTYNSYLIVDDKVTLIDGVYAPFIKESVDRIKDAVPLEKIDYVVVNHIEPDHIGSMPFITESCKGAKFFGTEKCKDGLKKFCRKELDFQVVKTGDKLSLGKKTLQFIEAPMIHWPDSMFGYLVEDAILLPNDAFGQHYATKERFDDETDEAAVMEEAEKYYANILWPFSQIILKKIEEIKKLNLRINMIAPSHGIIWRKSPEKIINAYMSWARNEASPKAVVVYETMYGATQAMAEKIAEGIRDAGLKAGIFEVNQSSHTEIILEMFKSRGYVVGSSSHDNGMLPNMAGFLKFLEGLKPKNRIGCAFGSYGWAGGAAKEIEDVFVKAGIELAQPGLSFKYMPDAGELKQCYEYGKAFAEKIRG